MKIAFVGKGGSGKSTMSALFIRYLSDILGEGVLALDADLNVNMAGLLGVEMPPEKYLSSPENSKNFRRYLKGTNQFIRDEEAFLPTTPPNTGSNLIKSVNDLSLMPFVVEVQSQPLLNLVAVGTYVSEDIGHTCYHGNLFVAENLLTHTQLPSNQWIVADMVAGTDAFSYSLHVQYDAIILIAEPTPESAEVCKFYFGLAKESRVEHLVHVLANKVEDEDDFNFIRHTINREPLGCIPTIKSLKKMRQNSEKLTVSMITPELQNVFRIIRQSAISPKISEKQRFDLMKNLHKNLCKQDWVISGYGEDVINQYGVQENFKKVG